MSEWNSWTMDQTRAMHEELKERWWEATAAFQQAVAEELRVEQRRASSSSALIAVCAMDPQSTASGVPVFLDPVNDVDQRQRSCPCGRRITGGPEPSASQRSIVRVETLKAFASSTLVSMASSSRRSWRSMT
jgi:hypothetical protein